MKNTKEVFLSSSEAGGKPTCAVASFPWSCCEGWRAKHDRDETDSSLWAIKVFFFSSSFRVLESSDFFFFCAVGRYFENPADSWLQIEKS